MAANLSTGGRGRLLVATMAAASVLAGCGSTQTIDRSIVVGGSPNVGGPSAGAPSSAGAGRINAVTAIPAVTGERLSAGEVVLRAYGFANIREVDATGQGRSIVDRTNWVIESQDPPAGTPATTGTTVTLEVAKPTDGHAPVGVTKGTVPNVVCANLQDAQDALRSAGFYVLTSKDGLGQGRVAVLDRNWVVIGQSVPAGATPPLTTHIVLTVVKYGEPVGESGCHD